MSSNKKDCWVNLFKGVNGIIYSGGVYHSKDTAEKEGKKSKDYIKTVKVELNVSVQ